MILDDLSSSRRSELIDARWQAGQIIAMLSIRPAVAEDARLILTLVRELAAYERESDAVVASEADFLRDGFGASPRFHVLLAEWDGQPAGFAFYLFTYSTWRGRPVLYLEDLFVRPEHRKKGIGLALMRRLAQIAVEEGCARFAWEVLDWNEPAIRFYESLGASVLRPWLNVRLEGDALSRLGRE
jgi:GNAT superfamily N-acetyltransferase